MYLAVDSQGKEYRFTYEPYRVYHKDIYSNIDRKIGKWKARTYRDNFYQLEQGTIEKWIGRKLTWDDAPAKTSQSAVDAKKAEQMPQGLMLVLREQTEDLRVLFLEKTRIYAENLFDWASKIRGRTIEDWCKHYNIEPSERSDFKVFPAEFFANEKIKKEYGKIIREATTIYLTGKGKLIVDAKKKAERHYENSLVKLVERLVRKGLTDTNFKIIEKSFNVNFELLLEHEIDGKKFVTRCWTIIAEGAIQKPHYRYLVK